MITAAAELDLPDEEPQLPALTTRSPTQLGTLTPERKRLLEAAIEEAEGKKATWAEEIKLERAAPRWRLRTPPRRRGVLVGLVVAPRPGDVSRRAPWAVGIYS